MKKKAAKKKEVKDKVAVALKETISPSGACQVHYKLTPPLKRHGYVVVSAVDVMFSGPETYIFPANKSGEITSFLELDGSFRGAKDHRRALKNVGYEVQS